jgi:hypothetical protein
MCDSNSNNEVLASLLSESILENQFVEEDFKFRHPPISRKEKEIVVHLSGSKLARVVEAPSSKVPVLSASHKAQQIPGGNNGATAEVSVAAPVPVFSGNSRAAAVDMDAEDEDPLDAFMTSLYGAGDVEEQLNVSSSISDSLLASKNPSSKKTKINPFGTNFITLNDIVSKSVTNENSNQKNVKSKPDVVSKMGWESDAPSSPGGSEVEVEDDDMDEQQRFEFISALKNASSLQPVPDAAADKDVTAQKLADEIAAAEKAARAEDEFGRIFAGEGDMIDEAEVQLKKMNAIQMWREKDKGKMLQPVDHSSITYIPFRKNLYIVPRLLSRLSEDQVREKREDLQIKVRGRGCPVPVDSWEQCGLSERVLQIIKKLNFETPFPIQKQCIPATMGGRDIIGVAKTGSGKTLAFLLPMVSTFHTSK